VGKKILGNNVIDSHFVFNLKQGLKTGLYKTIILNVILNESNVSAPILEEEEKARVFVNEVLEKNICKLPGGCK
jgi:hypothetical protein